MPFCTSTNCRFITQEASKTFHNHFVHVQINAHISQNGAISSSVFMSLKEQGVPFVQQWLWSLWINSGIFGSKQVILACCQVVTSVISNRNDITRKSICPYYNNKQYTFIFLINQGSVCPHFKHFEKLCIFLWYWKASLDDNASDGIIILFFLYFTLSFSIIFLSLTAFGY